MSIGGQLFQFSKAIVRQIPDTLAEQALRMNEPSSPVDMEKARLQHSHYVSRIRQLVPEVLVLPADNSQPDCVFVDDPAVVCNSVALICRMGHESRRSEAAVLKEALETLGLQTVEMTEPAKMDGGDVLFTGREFFVGLSSRTNREGLEFLASVFSQYKVTSVGVHDCLHLQSLATMAGDDIIAIADVPAGRQAWKDISQLGAFKYTPLWIPDLEAANVMYVNGCVLHRSHREFPASARVFQNLNCPTIEIENSELGKVDGALTCCSLLIN
jgi:dimethylargininase